MTARSSICVFCGSNSGTDPRFAEAAAELGTAMGSRGIQLVYGGGHVGLMGVVADATLAAGGSVVGVITEALAGKEIAHDSVTELIVVPSMHERKAVMSDRAEAFVMLPGGFGTLDEFFEAATWGQLGIHDKPCGMLDVAGFFEPLVAWIDDIVRAGFVRPERARSLVRATDVDDLLDRLDRWRPVTAEARLERDER